MQILTISQYVRYKVIPTSQGLHLRIWETAPTQTDNQAPGFLFKANYQLHSEEEVQAVLTYYQTNP